MSNDKITVRTDCKRGRATYHPEWGTSSLWVCYIDGEAMIHRRTLEACALWFSEKGMVLATPKMEQL